MKLAHAWPAGTLSFAGVRVVVAKLPRAFMASQNHLNRPKR